LNGCVGQKRQLQPLFFGQVPRTTSIKGRDSKLYRVESPTDELHACAIGQEVWIWQKMRECTCMCLSNRLLTTG